MKYRGVLLVFVFLLFMLSFVSASELTVNLFSEQTYRVGDIVPVDVYVTGVTDLYGYQLDLSYDGSRLSHIIESLASGDFLGGEGEVFFVNSSGSGSGFINDVAATRFDVSSGVSGSGVLFKINFTATSTGVANIDINLGAEEGLFNSSAGNLPTPDVVDLSFTIEQALSCSDADSDGYNSSAVSGLDCGSVFDCNDNNNNTWQFLTGYDDGDGDGYGTGSAQQICSGDSLPSGYVSNVDNGLDCNDSDSGINPGATEICDQVDNDCDGSADEGNVCVPACSLTSASWNMTDVVDQDLVSLTVVGDSCEHMEVNVTIFEYDLTFPDDFIESIDSLTFGAGATEVSTTWRASHINDQGGGDPEFYFVATLVETGETVSSGTGDIDLLHVSERFEPLLPSLTVESPENITYQNSFLPVNFDTEFAESCAVEFDGVEFEGLNCSADVSIDLSQYLTVGHDGMHDIIFGATNNNGSVSETRRFRYIYDRSLLVSYSEFSGKGSTTDLDSLSDVQFDDLSLILDNNVTGRIEFGSGVNLTRSVVSNLIDLDSNVNISRHRIFVNSSFANSTLMDRNLTNATLVFYGVTFDDYEIHKDGTACSSTDCKILNNTNSTLEVEVSGFSTYTVVDTTPSDDGGNDDNDGSSGGGGGGGGGGGSGGGSGSGSGTTTVLPNLTAGSGGDVDNNEQPLPGLDDLEEEKELDEEEVKERQLILISIIVIALIVVILSVVVIPIVFKKMRGPKGLKKSSSSGVKVSSGSSGLSHGLR